METLKTQVAFMGAGAIATSSISYAEDDMAEATEAMTEMVETVETTMEEAMPAEEIAVEEVAAVEEAPAAEESQRLRP